MSPKEICIYLSIGKYYSSNDIKKAGKNDTKKTESYKKDNIHHI